MAVILLRLHTLRFHAAKQALSVEILKLHHFGEPKYRALGRHYELAGIPEPAPSALRHLTERLLRGGIQLQRNES